MDASECAPVMDCRQARYRLVDRYVVHAGCAPLAERVADIVPRDAEYIVFDLDRTVHLDVAIGEQLGWEIAANPVVPTTPDAGDVRPILSMRAPLSSLRSVARGARDWALAGLLYAGTVRLGDQWPAWHRSLTLMLGTRYVERVQTMLRAALMASAAGYSVEQLATFCDRAWRRWQHRLVVDAEVIAALRRHCPRLKAVLLSSASTAPTVEHAAGLLGVDAFVSSAVDVYPDGERRIYSAPVGVPRGLRRRRPRFFSRPETVVHNSAETKISLLRMRYPEALAPGTVSVGISDNSYGEDRTWPDRFTHVVALNSRHPFSPLVAHDSPCVSIQTVDALPVGGSRRVGEKALRWHGTLRAGIYDRRALADRFRAVEIARLEALGGQLSVVGKRMRPALDASYRARLSFLHGRIGDLVDRYNRTAVRQKAVIARELAHLSRAGQKLHARIARAGRDCVRIEYEIEQLHKDAAQRLVTRAAG